MAQSATVTATTMDTTSHDFTWQTYEFGGQGRHSAFYDVAIIDENDIWAVGEIHTKDTDHWNADSTKWLQPYNAVHWDGEKWELKKIYFYLCPNDTYPTTYPIKSVFAFGKNDIWFARGGSLNHWNGSKFIHDCSVNKFLTGSINKIWGTSSSDLYIVGNNGLIAHYNGQQWQRIEIGTKVRLLDIYGNGNIWINGWNDLQPTVLLRIENGNLKKIIESINILNRFSLNKISGAIFSVWVDSHENSYVLTWNSLYRCFHGNMYQIKALWQGKKPSKWSYIKVRGDSENNIVTVGKRGRISHFNGITWKQYSSLLDTHNFLYSVSIRNNLIVAIGERYINAIQSYGLIYLGKR